MESPSSAKLERRAMKNSSAADIVISALGLYKSFRQLREARSERIRLEALVFRESTQRVRTGCWPTVEPSNRKLRAPSQFGSPSQTIILHNASEPRLGCVHAAHLPAQKPQTRQSPAPLDWEYLLMIAEVQAGKFIFSDGYSRPVPPIKLSRVELSLAKSVHDLRMYGVIKTVQKCRRCGGKFARTARGLECPPCGTRPTRLKIDVKKHDIFADQYGKPLTSWEQAVWTQFHISKEIEAGTFDPDRYRVRAPKDKLFVTIGDALKGRKEEEVIKNTSKSDGQKRGARAWISKYDNHVRPFFLSDRIENVRGRRIQEFLFHLQRTLKSRKMFFHVRGVLREILGHAAGLEEIERVPAFPKVEPPPENDRKTGWLTAEQQQIVLESADLHDGAIFKSMCRAGIRPGEALWLETEHVIVRGDPVTFCIKNTKANSRNIALEPQLGQTIKTYSDIRKAMKAQPGVEKYFFVTREGKRYSYSMLRKRWKKLMKKAIREGRLPEDALCTPNLGGRHSFQTQLREMGVPVEVVTDYSGTSLEMHKKFYDHRDVIKLPEKVGGTKGGPTRVGVV